MPTWMFVVEREFQIWIWTNPTYRWLFCYLYYCIWFFISLSLIYVWYQQITSSSTSIYILRSIFYDVGNTIYNCGWFFRGVLDVRTYGIRKQHERWLNRLWIQVITSPTPRFFLQHTRRSSEFSVPYVSDEKRKQKSVYFYSRLVLI